MRPLFRHIVCACCCALVLYACDKSPIRYKSPGYIFAYYSIGDYEKEPYIDMDDQSLTIFYTYTQYCAEAKYYAHFGYRYQGIKYYDLCVKYGDFKPGGQDCYENRYDKVFHGSGAVAIAEAIDAIHITSSEDWDAKHTAGTLLDDIFFAEYDSYYRYIRNNYTGEPVEHCRKPLADIRPGDMYLAHKISFNAETLPTVATQHTLTVEFLLDTGETIAYEAVIDFAAKEP